MGQVLHRLASSLGLNIRRRSRHYTRGENFAGFNLSLPPAPAAMLRAELAQAKIVLEYGSGGSTFLALAQGVDFILSIESDALWATRIRQALGGAHSDNRFHIHHADIGPTGAWGMPLDASGLRNYPAYASAPYDLPEFRHPDLIVVDGRFRTACFIAAMLRCTRPVRLLFDDYTDRPHYHWVERYAKPSQTAGRMALFELKPRVFPLQDLTKVLEAFVDTR